MHVLRAFVFLLLQLVLGRAFNVWAHHDQVTLSNPDGPVAATIEIPVDHFNKSDTRTYRNRYWMNDTYYKKGGPVFLYDNGEAGCSDAQAAATLTGTRESFTVVDLARRYNGIAILWEHRFYGQSLPFAVDNDTGLALAAADAYKYLTNEQALEDAVYFATHFLPPGQAEAVTASTTPWIWVGGSYAGVRAALVRQRNPDIFFASWSSSAPMHSVPWDSVYFHPIEQAMPSNCTADVHAAVSYADGILSNGSATDSALVRRAIFLANSVNPMNNGFYPNTTSPYNLSYWHLGHMLAYPFYASPVRFQSLGYDQALGGFCNQLEAWNPSNFTFNMETPASELANNPEDLNATTGGIAYTYGAEAAFYAYLHATIQKGMADARVFRRRPFSRADRIAWRWQLCSQVGQFQISNASSPTNLISTFINASSQANDCHLLFPYAPPKPDVAAILKYGDWHMRPSNVMSTSGALDPWRTLSAQATTQINPYAPNRPTTSEVPKCNEPPEGDAVFGLVYENAVHGADGRRPFGVPANVTTPYDLGMDLFVEALDEWLPCFKPS